MPDPMDRMQVDVNLGAHENQGAGSGIPPRVARRIVPADYVPDEGEVAPPPSVILNSAPTAPPVVEEPAAPQSVQIDEPLTPPVVLSPVDPAKVFEEVEEWQATDDQGRPVGPPSKIIGRGATQVEAFRDLTAKLREANISAAKKIKEYRDKYRTNRVPDQEQVSTSVEPIPLTAENRAQIARLMKDPATVDEGFIMLYEAEFGETPEQARLRLQRQRNAEWNAYATGQTDVFLRAHPDFPKGPVAKKLFLDEVQLRKNAAEADGKTFGWTANNLEIIYDDLVERGLLAPLQLQVNEPVVPSQIAPTVRASQEIIPQSATPANPPATVANTPVASGPRPRGMRHSGLTTEHGNSATDVAELARQASDDAFRKEADSLSLEQFRSRIRTDRKFAERYNNLDLRR